VVDVKRIPELIRVTYEPMTGLTVGAAVSCARLCEHPEVQRLYPGLVDAASLIGGAAIQGRATLGGNLCSAAPSADIVPAMIVLGGTCTIAGVGGSRFVAVEMFCTGPGQTVLGEDELLTAIHFPVPRAHSGAAYVRFIPRGEMDIAVAGAAAWICLSDDRSRIADARIALAAVAPTPLLVGAAGEALVGRPPTDALLLEAARLARQAARPITDIRGTAAQRRHLVGVLVERALRRALSRAKGTGVHGE
jgi:carbon-monoxide dehydrogenase medium subunit